MGRRRLAVLGTLGGALAVTGLVWLLAPERIDTAVARSEEVIADAPDPVVIGVTTLLVLVIWILGMIYTGKFFYWSWKQVGPYVDKVWNTLLPESPIVRFSVGLMVMIVVFLIGPMLLFQQLEFFEDDEDPVEEQQNQSDSDDDGTEGVRLGPHETPATGGQSGHSTGFAPGTG
jgi:hypothetical protein